MVQLYDTYTTASFSALIEKTDMTKYGDIVPFETAQIDEKRIVPFEIEPKHWHHSLQRGRHGSCTLCFESQYVANDGGSL